ncbi:PREDICTED: uncharacterized protein LOC109231305 [Nicotiana attenuata]|uniref:Uncharacterized protein n=1 Tax=Nicotiana attenuata TaxID=49451 RepID=A0A1J6IPU4_NICAT|nr:PREDICTED: uncharacterized protein LOC109231305 [Nicotiana attenuata]OIS99726.1 hypothetical protein A4A49_02478 [Nicotiana attenuata]
MPTRMVTYLRERTVYVSVLVEGPRRKRSSSSNNKYHHQHLHIRQVANGGGYNRKAQLLDYSRNLRATARSQPSTPLVPQPIQRQNSQIVAVKNKPRYVSLPTCMGSWKFVMPRFLRTFMPQNKKSKKKKNMASNTNKIKAMVKTFQVQRKPGLFSKFFASLRKGRR